LSVSTINLLIASIMLLLEEWVRGATVVLELCCLAKIVFLVELSPVLHNFYWFRFILYFLVVIFFQVNRSILPHLLFQTLEVPIINIILPIIRYFRQLLPFQKNVRSLVLSSDFTTFIFVFVIYIVWFFWETFGVCNWWSAFMSEGYSWDIFAAHHYWRVFERSDFLWLMHWHYYIASLCQ